MFHLKYADKKWALLADLHGLKKLPHFTLKKLEEVVS